MDFDEMYAGRMIRIWFQMEKAAGVPLPLNGRRIRFMLKPSDTAADSEALADYWIEVGAADPWTVTTGQKTGLQGGIVLGRPDPADETVMIDTTYTSGWVTVEIDDDDSAAWTAGKRPWELTQTVVASNDVLPLASGMVTVNTVLQKQPKVLPT